MAEGLELNILDSVLFGAVVSGTLCKTTHSWNSEPQNIEQEISNDEVWNRFALTISD
jgi:hypothetical protein